MKFPSPSEWFTTVPPYSKAPFPVSDNWAAAELLNYSGNFDNYCVDCGRESTFSRETPKSEESNAYLLTMHRLQRVAAPVDVRPGTYLLTVQCSRNSMHLQHFLFHVVTNRTEQRGTVEKIGQHPSYGDLQVHKSTRYKHVLTPAQAKELSRAIGLAAHDVGIAAYVYLRRIFEGLIEEARCEASQSVGWSDEAYVKSRMAERVQLLKNHLPEFLVKNAAMYSVLSKGIHELQEEECLIHFQTLRLAIELILDERHAAREKKKLIDEAERAIQSMLSGNGVSQETTAK